AEVEHQRRRLRAVHRLADLVRGGGPSGGDVLVTDSRIVIAAEPGAGGDAGADRLRTGAGPAIGAPALVADERLGLALLGVGEARHHPPAGGRLACAAQIAG